MVLKFLTIPNFPTTFWRLALRLGKNMEKQLVIKLVMIFFRISCYFHWPAKKNPSSELPSEYRMQFKRDLESNNNNDNNKITIELSLTSQLSVALLKYNCRKEQKTIWTNVLLILILMYFLPLSLVNNYFLFRVKESH